MKKLSIIIIFILMLIAYPALSYKQYTGETPQDLKFAKYFYNLMQDSGVYAVEVNKEFMVVNIREKLYRMMVYDKIKGKQLIRNWVRLFQNHVDESSDLGTVFIYIYFDNTKVIEAKSNYRSTDITINYKD